MTEPTRTRYGVVAFAMALVVITYVDRVCMAQAAPAVRKELGLTAAQTGYVFSAFGLAYTLFEIPSGWLGDWIGPRRVLTRIVIWWSFFTAATGWAWNLPSLLATRFLFGAGEAGCFPTLNKAFTVWLTPKERPLAQGLKSAAYMWGGAITPYLVVLLLQRMSWRHVFELFGAIGVIWAVPFYYWYRDDPATHKRVNAAELALLPGASLASGHADTPWRPFLSSRSVWLLCLQWFCYDYGFYFYLTWLPTYLLEARGLDIHRSALLAGLPLLAAGSGNVFSGLLVPHLVRRAGGLSRARRLLAGMALTGASATLLLFISAKDPIAAMALMGLSGFSAALSEPVSWTTCMDLGGKSVGTLSAAMNTMGQLGGAVSPAVVGLILERTNHNWTITFYISAAIYLLGACCWALIDPVTPLGRVAPAGSAAAAPVAS